MVRGPRTLVVLACLAAIGLESNKAAALDVEEAAPSSSQWCFAEAETGDANGDHPVRYETIFACMLAAFGHANPARSDKLTTAERAELYHKFQLWQERQESSQHQ